MKEFRHYRQPQYAATIDQDNPLARGITDWQTGWNTAGWTKNAGPTQKFVADTTYANRAGLAQTYASASSQYLSKTPQTVNYPFTFAALTKRTVVGAVTQGVMSMGAGTADRHLMYWSSDVLVMFSGSGATVDQAVSGAGFNSTTHIYACVGVVPASGANRVIYIDGVAGTTGTGSVATAASSTLAIGAYWSSGAPVAGFYDNANTLLAVVWNRALSLAEIREWSLRPWQIFEPVKQRSRFAESAVIAAAQRHLLLLGAGA